MTDVLDVSEPGSDDMAFATCHSIALDDFGGIVGELVNRAGIRSRRHDPDDCLDGIAQGSLICHDRVAGDDPIAFESLDAISYSGSREADQVAQFSVRDPSVCLELAKDLKRDIVKHVANTSLIQR